MIHKPSENMWRPLLFAHRGASLELPENSMAAFERAVEIGVDVIESDVHLTADGHVVLAHDACGLRMAGNAQQIADASLNEIQEWDIGLNHQSPAGQKTQANKGHRIPTLREALDALPHMRWNLDVKVTHPNAWQRVIEVIKEKHAEDRVLLASFSATTLESIRRAGYQGETGMGERDVAFLACLPSFILRLPFPMRPNGDRVQVPIQSKPFTFASTWFIQKCRALGLYVDFWTINDEDEAMSLLDLGVDGIMTDDPERMKTLLDRAFPKS